MIKKTRRRRPHTYVIGQPLFVTFRLRGCLPKDRDIAERSILSVDAFACYDGLLDRATSGPVYLRIPAIAEIVVKAIEPAAVDSYTLHAWSVMPNHAHLLITPLIDPAVILNQFKGRTAREANLELGRQRQPFWQHESYDRVVRGAEEFRRIENYIVWNPVRA